MSRYIDADEINANYIKLKEKRGVEYPSPRRILNMTLQAIDMCKTADAVEVKHGKWIKHGIDIAEHPLRCSVCSWGNHHIANRYVLEMDYCPNCGARMDGME